MWWRLPRRSFLLLLLLRGMLLFCPRRLRLRLGLFLLLLLLLLLRGALRRTHTLAPAASASAATSTAAAAVAFVLAACPGLASTTTHAGGEGDAAQG